MIDELTTEDICYNTIYILCKYVLKINKIKYNTILIKYHFYIFQFFFILVNFFFEFGFQQINQIC